MSEADKDREPLEALAEEFQNRLRRGEQPTLEEYAVSHPELTDEIRDLFPALIAMEQLKPGSDSSGRSRSDSVMPCETAIQQLGDFRILREIGRGGMGIVYEAEQVSLGRRVALKVLPQQMATDGKSIERFQREARATARMHHTNIVPIFDVGHDEDRLYYAMQLIHGQGLDLVIEELRRLQQDNFSSGREASPGISGSAPSGEMKLRSIAHSLMSGRLETAELGGHDTPANASVPDTFHPSLAESASDIPETQSLALKSSTVSPTLPGGSEVSAGETNKHRYHVSVARIGLQVADALAYAHARGVIHRDVKPSNLLLDTEGVVWVTDFGLAKTDESVMTRTGDILGTIRYMSPERFRGQCDARADIYALGLTLYELLVLCPAYQSTDRLELVELIKSSNLPRPRTIDRSIPRDLETVVLKCVDVEARRRYQSADELAEDLHRFINDQPINARRVSPMERVARWARRNKTIAALGATVVTLLLIGSIAFAGLWAKERESRTRAEKELSQRVTQIIATYLNEESFAQFQENLLQLPNVAQADRPFELGHMLRVLTDYELNSHELTLPYIPSHIAQIPNRDWVAITHGSSPIVAVWDLVSGTRVKQFGTENAPMWGNLDGFRFEVCLAAAPDGQSLAFADDSEKRIVLVDLDQTSSQSPRTVAESDTRFTGVAFSPDGTQLAAIDENTVVRTFSYPDLRAMGEYRVGPSPHATGIGAIAYSDNSSLLATSVAGCIEVRELESQQVIYSFQGESAIFHNIAFCPGRSYLFVADNTFVRHDYVRDVRTTFNWERSYSVCVSSDGSTVVTGGVRKVIEIWDTDSGKTIQTLRGHWGSSKDVIFLKASSEHPFSLASVGYDRKLVLWKLKAQHRRSAIDQVICADDIPTNMKLNPEHDFAFLPNKMGLVIKAYGMVTIRDIEAPFTQRHAWRWDTTLRSLDVSNSGLIAVGDDAGDVHVFDGELKEFCVLSCPSPDLIGKRVFSLGFLANDNQIAVGRQSGRVEMWDIRERKMIDYRHLHQGRVLQIEHVPTRNQLVSVAPGEVKLWDAELETVHELRAPQLDRFSEDLALSPDENLLAVVSPFSGTFLWDLRDPSSEAHRCLTPGRGVTFSKDGQALFIMGGSLHILDICEIETGGRPKLKVRFDTTGSTGGRTEMSPDGASIYVIGGRGVEPVLNVWRSK